MTGLGRPNESKINVLANEWVIAYCTYVKYSHNMRKANIDYPLKMAHIYSFLYGITFEAMHWGVPDSRLPSK